MNENENPKFETAVKTGLSIFFISIIIGICSNVYWFLGSFVLLILIARFVLNNIAYTDDDDF